MDPAIKYQQQSQTIKLVLSFGCEVYLSGIQMGINGTVHATIVDRGGLMTVYTVLFQCNQGRKVIDRSWTV